jgi:hypothetical protein
VLQAITYASSISFKVGFLKFKKKQFYTHNLKIRPKISPGHVSEKFKSLAVKLFEQIVGAQHSRHEKKCVHTRHVVN